MDDMPSAMPGFASAQPGFASAQAGFASQYGSNERRSYDTSGPRESSYATGRGAEMERAGYTMREEVPMPDKPPFTAHIGNLSFEASEADIGDFFGAAGASVKNVRLVRDRETERPRGFGYVEFNDLQSLKNALPLSGSPLAGRDIRVTVAEAPRGSYGDREPERDLDWGSARARGPLPPQERSSRYGHESRDREPRERELRSPREPERDLDWSAARTRGPLPPAERQSFDRRDSARSNGERRPYERADSNRTERRDNGPELDWSSRKGPLAPAEPSSTLQGPAERRKLALTPRSGTSTPTVSSPSSKPSPFGAAKAVDTTAAEQKADEKRQALARERQASFNKEKEDKKDKKFDPRTDKPFDILRRTEEMSLETQEPLDTTEPVKSVEAEVKAEEQETAAVEREEGWSTIAKK